MSDHNTPDPASILPPDIEAARQQLLAATQQSSAATKEALEAQLGRPLSQEAYDYLVTLVAQARAGMTYLSQNPPVSWTTLDIPDDPINPDA